MKWVHGHFPHWSGLDFSTKKGAGEKAGWRVGIGWMDFKSSTGIHLEDWARRQNRGKGEAGWSNPVFHASPISQRYPGEFRQESISYTYSLVTPAWRCQREISTSTVVELQGGGEGVVVECCT
jgi:hypothetical protein